MFVIHLMIPIFVTDPYQNLDRSQSKLRQISCPLPNKFNEKRPCPILDVNKLSATDISSFSSLST